MAVQPGPLDTHCAAYPWHHDRACLDALGFCTLSGKLTACTRVACVACVQGVLYHDRMKPSEVEKIRPRLVELEEAFLAANPGVKVQRVGAAKAAAKGFGSPSRR